MANRVQIVVTVDADQAGTALAGVNSALKGMGSTAVAETGRATRGFQQFEQQGLLKAVLGANLAERALLAVGRAMKSTVVDSTLLSARADVLDTVLIQVAKNTGNSAAVFKSTSKAIRALGVDQIRSTEATIKFATAELSVADAVRIANVARNRAQISGETTSETMERLTRSILAQEVELLKLAGIVVRQEDAFKRYGETIGKAAKDLNELERRQAFVNEILRQTRNDVGLYEQAWEKAGKRLLSIPRLARQAGIALGREFQGELALGVDTTIKFLKVVEENSAALVTGTTAVVGLTFAYVALRIAMSETILVNVGAFLSGLLPKLLAVSGGIETLSLLLMGAGGTVGLIGAWGLLAAVGVSLGVVLGKISVHFQNQSELAKVAQFDIEGWRKKLAESEIEVRSNEEAMLLLNRVSDVNNKLREKGLPPLKLNKDLLEQLRAAEDGFRFSTDAGTDALEKRAKAVERLNEQLEKQRFALSLVGLGETDAIQARASREIDQLLKKAKEFPESAVLIQETIAQLSEATDIKLDRLRSKQRDESAKFLLDALDRNLGAVERIEAARDSELAKAAAIAKRFPELRDVAARAEVEIAKEAMREITALRARELQEAESFVRSLERQTALSNADPFERIQIERAGRLEEIERNLNLSQEQAERSRVAINADANAAIRSENTRVADEQRRQWERNAQEYDRFLDRMVRFTDQSGSFIKNIWRTLSDEFQRSVTKMVLSWVFGLAQLRNSTAGGVGVGGGLGSLASIIFGGGGASTSARTPPFVNSAFGGLSIPGVGVGSGAAGTIPGAVPTGGGAGGVGGLLGLGQGGNAGPLLGLLLGLQVGSGGRPVGGLLAGLGGVLGGVALSGAAAGAAGGIGALAGSGVALAGFLTNPVGLAILGGIGVASFLAGVISRGNKKEKASKIADEGFASIDQQIRSFELRQSSFNQTVPGMNQVWAQMVQGWEQIGGSVGARSTSDQRRFFEERLRRVEDLQEKRNSRADLIAGLPVPEFATGGIVRGAAAKPVLIAAHDGEFVLNRNAVDRIGVPTLEQANGGGDLGGGGNITVNIHTPDKRGVEELLRNNASLFQRFVTSVIRQGVRDGNGFGFSTT